MGALLCFTGGGYGVRMAASLARQSEALRAVIAASVVMVSKAVDVGAAADLVFQPFAGCRARSAATPRAGTPRTPAASRGHRPDVLPRQGMASTASTTRPYWGRGPRRCRVGRIRSGSRWPLAAAPTWSACPGGCAGSGCGTLPGGAISTDLRDGLHVTTTTWPAYATSVGAARRHPGEKGAAARTVQATDGTPAPTGRVLLRAPDSVWPAAIGTRLRRAARPPRWRHPFMFCGGRGCGGVVVAGPRRWVG
jgi:hypothetical protein